MPVELIVNGYAVDKKLIEADGRVEEIEFDDTPERSSWVVVRFFPTAHINPIFGEIEYVEVIWPRPWPRDHVNV